MYLKITLILSIFVEYIFTSDPNYAMLFGSNIFSTYSKLVRPRRKINQTVDVMIDIVLKQLVQVDAHSQQMTLLIWHRQKWRDDFLTWDPSDRNGIQHIRIDPNSIWLPDIIYHNSVGNFEHLQEVTLVPPRLQYNGDLIWLMPLIKTTMCRMNVRFFPWDVQRCSLKIGSWSSGQKEINISLYESGEELIKIFIQHHEWSLVMVEKTRIETGYTSFDPTDKYAHLEFWFTFRRKPSFYVKNLIIPTALISGLAMVTFLLPNDSGEKIGFAVTVFLSLCVNLMVITTYIPVSSETFPLIGEYYLTCICLIAASILQTTFILSLHFTHYGIQRAPKMLRMVFFDIIGPPIGFSERCCKMWNKESVNYVGEKIANRVSPKRRRKSRSTSKDRKESRENYVQNPTKHEEDFEIHRGILTIIKHTERMTSLLEQAEERKIHKHETTTIIAEWQYLTRIVDRISAILFSIVTTGFTLYFLLNAKYGEPEKWVA